MTKDGGADIRLTQGDIPHAYLATILITLLLAIPAMSVEGVSVSRRCRGWRNTWERLGCWGATEQKTGLSKFQATSSRTSAGFLNGRNSPRVTASGTEKA